MRIELRTDREGQNYYSFVYYDSNAKKRIRLRKEEVQKRFGTDIHDHQRAVEVCRILEAEVDSLHSRIKRRISWEKEFFNFNELTEYYEMYQKKNAPNSYKNNIHYFKYYVLPFFLKVNKCYNIAYWHNEYANFRDWLEEDARLVRKPEQKLSYASMNHAIKSLNTFLKILFQRKIITSFLRCDAFPNHTLKELSIEDVIFPNEMEEITKDLLNSNYELESIYFRFMFFTGMRPNEALGLNPGNIYSGKIENKSLERQLHQAGITYYGYIFINSQPSHNTRGLRDKEGMIHYKPLKGRKKIDDKSGRTIAIIDKKLWNHIVKLHNIAIEKHSKQQFGSEIDQYPIFEGIDKTTASLRLQKTYEKLGLHYRPWKCLRHSRATFLVGETGNPVLARIWLGHRTEKTLERYVHIYEAINRSVKKKRNGNKFAPLIPI
jgi:integrase